ncbi:O-antigen ligase family protein [Micromonospora sp. NPDC049559]|uniref:O-antigen ligase family protein n=1 Tax=Micromonospora sp. NPDC049559 TaxID=3155923 RepID=UPI00342EE4C8
MPTYLSARRSTTVYDGLLPARGRLRGAAAGVVLATMLAYLLPSRLIFPPLSDLGKPGIMLALGLLVWWGLSRLHPTLCTTGRQPMRWAIAGYLVTIGASYIAAQSRGMSPLESNGAHRAMITALAGAGMLLTAADGVLTRERIDHVLRWLCWGGTVMALFALSQFALRRDFTTYLRLPPLLAFQRDLIGFDARGGGGLVRVAGTAGHYIEFSVLMVIGLVLAIHFARYSVSRRDRQLYGAVAVLQAGVIPISLSRTGVLALAAAILLFVLVWPLRTTFNVLVVGCFLAAAIQVVRPGLLATLRALILAGDNDPSVRGRLEDYDFVGPYIRERPWFGRGYGTWLPSLYQLLDNQWLVTLVTTGVVGVTGLVLLFLAGVVLAGRVRRFAGAERDRDLAGVLAVALGVAAVSAFTYDALYFTTYLLTVHLLLGLVGALWRVTRAERINQSQGAP